MMLSPEEHDIFIVTGLSGAGKSIVLRSLEDSGFFCIDNLPYSLLVSFFACIKQAQFPNKKVALGLDVRGNMMDKRAVQQLITLCSTSTFNIRIIFLSATEETLIKRFQETRRLHPLHAIETDLHEAIKREARLLKPLQKAAHYVIDTDQLTLHQLRSYIRSLLSSNAPPITVMLISFGFKHGTPSEHNFVFDIRSLPNPHFVDHLRDLDGRSAAIHDYLFSHASVQEYWSILTHFITMSLKHIQQEGRFFVTIAIGCTGGKHRSVTFVEKLASLATPSVQFFIKHRDITKEKDIKP